MMKYVLTIIYKIIFLMRELTLLVEAQKFQFELSLK